MVKLPTFQLIKATRDTVKGRAGRIQNIFGHDFKFDASFLMCFLLLNPKLPTWSLAILSILWPGVHLNYDSGFGVCGNYNEATAVLYKLVG